MSTKAERCACGELLHLRHAAGGKDFCAAFWFLCGRCGLTTGPQPNEWDARHSIQWRVKKRQSEQKDGEK